MTAFVKGLPIYIKGIALLLAVGTYIKLGFYGIVRYFGSIEADYANGAPRIVARKGRGVGHRERKGSAGKIKKSIIFKFMPFIPDGDKLFVLW